MTSVTDLFQAYDSTLRSILDIHAPLKKKIKTVRPPSPWFTDEIHQLKLRKRRMERRWRSSKSQTDRDSYVVICRQLNTAITNSKMSFYSSIIDEKNDDQRVLFNTFGKMLHKSMEKLNPKASTPHELANNFADFFSNKITDIRVELMSRNAVNMTSFGTDGTQSCSSTIKLDNFLLVTETQVAKIATSTASKSCSLDPLAL